MAYKAFLVGVNTLGLKYCSDDATHLSDSLKAYGYETYLPGSGWRDAFIDMLDGTDQDDTLLLYFAGHGLVEKGKLWFLLADDATKQRNKLNLNEWLELFFGCRVSSKLVILDCCHALKSTKDLSFTLDDPCQILAASGQMEKSRELSNLKAGFFTDRLCKALSAPPKEILDGKTISILKLKVWLEQEAKTHNSKAAANMQVPLPKLLGLQEDVTLAVLPDTGAVPAAVLTTEVRRRQQIEEEYRRLLLETCDIVSLANLPEQDRHLATRKLELRRLYVPLRARVEVMADKEADEARWEELERRRLAGKGWLQEPEDAKRNLQRIPVGERLDKSRRLVVLGDPGAGKSTLLRWIATAYLLRLKGDTDWRNLPDVETLPGADWLPIIIRCRDLGVDCAAGALDDMLCHTLRKAEMAPEAAADMQAMLRERLTAGTALLMLDGLDEITDPGLRARFCAQVERIQAAYPAAPIIATSRIVGYREMGYRLGHEFEHLTLADLEKSEKDDFIRRWCALTELPERRLEAERDLIHDVHSSDRIERMTGNPMLLTTLALVKRKVGKLPSRRADLYGEAVQVLLNWRREVDEPLDLHEAIPQLEYLAYAMCDRGIQRLRRGEIIHLIQQMREEYPNVHQARNHTPEEFLHLLESRTGLVIEAGHERHLGLDEEVYEFRHLTFQEYLAARALVDGRFPGKVAGRPLADHIAPLAGRTEETDITYNMGEDIAVTETWSEVLRLCCSICADDDIDNILHSIATPLDNEPPSTARARAILAALCIADEPHVSEEVARYVFSIFASQIGKVDRNYDIRTGVQQAAAAVAETRWSALLCDCLVDEFLCQDPLYRDYWGDVTGIVYAQSLSSDPEASSAWWTTQTSIMQEGTEFQAIKAALGISAVAGSKNTDLVTSALIKSLRIRLSGTAPMAHAAAEALASLNGYLSGNRTWIPDTSDINKFIEFILISTSDSEAIRFLASIMKEFTGVNAVDPLIGWFDHPNNALRCEIARTLGAIGSVTTLEPLLSHLNDPDAEVRSAVAQALGNQKSERAVEPLITQLDDPDAVVRSAVAYALGNLKSECAVEPLITRLDDPDAVVRSAVAYALGNLKSECAVEPLITRLDDPDVGVRCALVDALGNLKSERAVEPLITRLEDPNARVRSMVVHTLGDLKSESAIEPLIARLNDPDLDVRYATVDVLSRFKIERAVEPLITRLGDEVSVRYAIGIALKNIGSEHAVDLLILQLDASDAGMQQAAAAALGQIGCKRAVEPLVPLLAASDVGVQQAAAIALGQIGSECAVEPLIRLLDASDVGAWQAAATALGQIGSERAVEPLIQLLDTSNVGVRQAAATALGRIGSDRAEEPLIQLLDASDLGVWQAAATALGRIGSERAVEPLIELLDNQNAQMRQVTAVALGQTGSESAVEPLITLLDDHNAKIRQAAAAALGKIGSERAVEPLITLLDDHNAKMRQVVVAALGKIGSECAVEPLIILLDDNNASMRKAAIGSLSQQYENEDRRLLSKDFNGVDPFIDPHEPISFGRIELAASKTNLTPDAVRARYEVLAPQFKLQLAW
ncbi:MAG: HEAT repeat domain-containing protein [Armatimonadota bacterium]